MLEKKINDEIVSDKRGIKYLKQFKDIKISEINSSSIYNRNFIQKLIILIKAIFNNSKRDI